MSSVRAFFARRGLVRPRRGRMVAGVGAAIARALNVRPAVVRVAFVVSILLPGPQFLLYAALWLALPVEGSLEAGAAAPTLPA